MRRENIRLKKELIIQAFLPLFVLLFVKYFDISFCEDIKYSVTQILSKDWGVFKQIRYSVSFWKFVLCVILLIYIIRGLSTVWGFRDLQKGGLYDAGEKIVIHNEITENSLGFFVTFIIPLLLDDIVSLRNLLVFLLVMLFLTMLMWKTNLYYQNPVLSILGYKVFQIEFVNPILSQDKNCMMLAITKDELDMSKTIVRKYISDNVFYLENKK